MTPGDGVNGSFWVELKMTPGDGVSGSFLGRTKMTANPVLTWLLCVFDKKVMSQFDTSPVTHCVQ